MDEMIYQFIFDEISEITKINWERMVIYLEYGTASYSFVYYVKSNGEYIQCFDVEGLSEDIILQKFRNIDSRVSQERKSCDKWSTMTMTISDTGDFKVDFDYSDLSQGTYLYKKEWKKKYLI